VLGWFARQVWHAAGEMLGNHGTRSMGICCAHRAVATALVMLMVGTRAGCTALRPALRGVLEGAQGRKGMDHVQISATRDCRSLVRRRRLEAVASQTRKEMERRRKAWEL